MWQAVGRVLVLGVVVLLMAPGGARAEETADRERALQDELVEVKRQVRVLTEEVSRLRTQVVVPEETELKSAYGMGPAASKIYGVPRGISIGGYAEAFYRRQIGDADGNGSDQADFLRSVLYIGHKFDDKWLFNAEFEFEHATTSATNAAGNGSVSVEFAALEYLYSPELNFRAGLLLVPMGFLNELHEPPSFFGTARPEPESQIIPSTWRENGVGIFGEVDERLRYRFYVMNGLDANGFSSSGLRGGRQNGNRVRADSLAWVGRVDLDVTQDLQVGFSMFQGDSGQDQPNLPEARTRIWEVHAEYETGGFHFRGLYTQADVGDASALSVANSSTVAERLIGGYAEVAYDIMPWLGGGPDQALSPFFRFEYLDPQADVPSGFATNRGVRRRLFIPGIQYQPRPNLVLKMDYRNIDSFGGNSADELRFGIGLAF